MTLREVALSTKGTKGSATLRFCDFSPNIPVYRTQSDYSYSLRLCSLRTAHICKARVTERAQTAAHEGACLGLVHAISTRGVGKARVHWWLHAAAPKVLDRLVHATREWLDLVGIDVEIVATGRVKQLVEQASRATCHARVVQRTNSRAVKARLEAAKGIAGLELSHPLACWIGESHRG